MTGLDFANLWNNAPPEKQNNTQQQQTAPKQAQDSNQYIELRKEYQQYIQFNKEMDQQRRAVNKMMIDLIKASKEGKPNDLLDDSLKIISLLMRDEAFYIQVKNNLEENPHRKPK